MANHINLPWLDLVTIYLGDSVPVSMPFFSKKKKQKQSVLCTRKRRWFGHFQCSILNSNVKKHHKTIKEIYKGKRNAPELWTT